LIFGVFAFYFLGHFWILFFIYF